MKKYQKGGEPKKSAPKKIDISKAKPVPLTKPGGVPKINDPGFTKAAPKIPKISDPGFTKSVPKVTKINENPFKKKTTSNLVPLKRGGSVKKKK